MAGVSAPQRRYYSGYHGIQGVVASLAKRSELGKVSNLYSGLFFQPIQNILSQLLGVHAILVALVGQLHSLERCSRHSLQKQGFAGIGFLFAIFYWWDGAASLPQGTQHPHTIEGHWHHVGVGLVQTRVALGESKVAQALWFTLFGDELVTEI